MATNHYPDDKSLHEKARDEILSPEEMQEYKKQSGRYTIPIGIISIAVTVILSLKGTSTNTWWMAFLAFPAGFIIFFVGAILTSKTEYDSHIDAHAENLRTIAEQEAEKTQENAQSIKAFLRKSGYGTDYRIKLAGPEPSRHVYVGRKGTIVPSISIIDEPESPNEFAKSMDIRSLNPKTIPIEDIEYVGYTGDITRYTAPRHKEIIPPSRGSVAAGAIIAGTPGAIIGSLPRVKYHASTTHEVDRRMAVIRYRNSGTGMVEEIIFDKEAYGVLKTLVPEKTYDKYIAQIAAQADGEERDADNAIEEQEVETVDQNPIDNPQDELIVSSESVINQPATDVRSHRRKRLRELKELFEDNLITQEEYEAKREEILREI